MMLLDILGTIKNFLSAGAQVAKYLRNNIGQQPSNILIKSILEQCYHHMMAQGLEHDGHLAAHRRKRRRHMDDEDFDLIEAARKKAQIDSKHGTAYFLTERPKNLLTFARSKPCVVADKYLRSAAPVPAAPAF